MAKKRSARPEPPKTAAVPGPKTLDPTALSAEDLAELLGKIHRGPIDAEQIRADVAAGAPTNADGTMDLVHYTAWLAAEA